MYPHSHNVSEGFRSENHPDFGSHMARRNQCPFSNEEKGHWEGGWP